jgi:uncharacterized membrane protein YccC
MTSCQGQAGCCEIALMTRIPREDVKKTRPQRLQTGEVILYGAGLAIACFVSYWLITRILGQVYSISRDDDLLGGIWAVGATLFVYRYSYEQSIRAALSRMAATSVSFVLCLVYLLILPFHSWGLAALIGTGAAAMALLGRPDDTVVTGITTAIVMAAAGLSPHNAWQQPILRVVDTAVGVAIGIAAARVSLWATYQRRVRRLLTPCSED